MDVQVDRAEEEALSMLDGKDLEKLIEILEVVRSREP
jgi:predicted house-cleaning noncanonical NTP pyrophosphatase (MazG superfamily)